MLAALESHGKGVLLCGPNGCGKTTAMLSLLRAGYRYLADDIPFLQDRDSAQHLLATSLNIDVTDHTIEMFPELRAARFGVLRQGAYRKSFHPADVYPESPGRSCEPAMIVFPQVTKIPHSCLEPLPKSLALEALVQRQACRHDADTAVQEFQVLAKLVQRAACYRLHFGSDVLDLPRLITPLLERH